MSSVETSLDEDQIRRSDELINRNFASIGNKTGESNMIEHKIIEEGPPIQQRYYPVSPVIQKHIDQQLDEMLEEIIGKSNSPCSSPVIMVKRRDGGYRFGAS